MRKDKSYACLFLYRHTWDITKEELITKRLLGEYTAIELVNALYWWEIFATTPKEELVNGYPSPEKFYKHYVHAGRTGISTIGQIFLYQQLLHIPQELSKQRRTV